MARRTPSTTNKTNRLYLKYRHDLLDRISRRPLAPSSSSVAGQRDDDDDDDDMAVAERRYRERGFWRRLVLNHHASSLVPGSTVSSDVSSESLESVTFVLNGLAPIFRCSPDPVSNFPRLRFAHPLMASLLWSRVRSTLSRLRQASAGDDDDDDDFLWRVNDPFRSLSESFRRKYGEPFLNLDALAFPTCIPYDRNTDKHWVLIVVYRRLRKIYVYNSLYCRRRDTFRLHRGAHWWTQSIGASSMTTTASLTQILSCLIRYVRSCERFEYDPSRRLWMKESHMTRPETEAQFEARGHLPRIDYLIDLDEEDRSAADNWSVYETGYRDVQPGRSCGLYVQRAMFEMFCAYRDPDRPWMSRHTTRRTLIDMPRLCTIDLYLSLVAWDIRKSLWSWQLRRGKFRIAIYGETADVYFRRALYYCIKTVAHYDRLYDRVDVQYVGSKYLIMQLDQQARDRRRRPTSFDAFVWIGDARRGNYDRLKAERGVVCRYEPYIRSRWALCLGHSITVTYPDDTKKCKGHTTVGFMDVPMVDYEPDDLDRGGERGGGFDRACLAFWKAKYPCQMASTSLFHYIPDQRVKRRTRTLLTPAIQIHLMDELAPYVNRYNEIACLGHDGHWHIIRRRSLPLFRDDDDDDHRQNRREYVLRNTNLDIVIPGNDDDDDDDDDDD